MENEKSFLYWDSEIQFLKQFKFKDKIMGSPYLLSPPLESLSPLPKFLTAPPPPALPRRYYLRVRWESELVDSTELHRTKNRLALGTEKPCFPSNFSEVISSANGQNLLLD